MEQRLPVFILLIFLVGVLYAQDPIFSQYYTNKMYLNPALTGFEGGMTINTNYRNQWYRIDGRDAEFTTKSVGVDFDIPCQKSSFGLLYVDNIEGIGEFRRQRLGLSYAFRPRPQSGRLFDEFEWAIGIKTAYSWQSINWNRFIFSDQLDVFGPTGGLSGFTPPENQPGGYLDLGLGGYMMWKSREGNRLRVGAAASHVISPAILSVEDVLPLRLTVHGSYAFVIKSGSKRKFEVIPMFKLDMQQASEADTTRFRALFTSFWYRSVQYGVAFNVAQTPGVWGGIWYQSRHELFADPGSIPSKNNIGSLIAAAGVEFGDEGEGNSYRLGLSYDYNIHGNVFRGGGGTLELSFVMNFDNAQIIDCKRRSLPCPF